MRLHLHGGFGEKGRTSFSVESAGYRLLVDAGVKTSAHHSADYYPAISPKDLRAIDAIIITHAHEDHIAALGWCIAGGFRGRILMTAETRRDGERYLADYATHAELELVRQAAVEPLSLGADVLALGPLRISTGRSGHMAGSVWCNFDDGRVRLTYCGDMVTASGVFAMDPLPRSDAMIIDTSYGDDDASATERARQVAAWVAARPQGSVLPTPLYGRSAELLATVDGPVALAPGMRDALRTQIEGHAWLAPHAGPTLVQRLAASADWDPDQPLPRAALLCHDGMGISGPSREILARASHVGHPTLFTGHVPANSPGEQMMTQGRASWIRLPTHPTCGENRRLVAASGAERVIGHSCERSVLERLKVQIPQLNATLATGDCVEL